MRHMAATGMTIVGFDRGGDAADARIGRNWL